MTLVTFGVVYAGIAVFVAACSVRAVRYATAPVHLRWELYPVPHEPPQRVRHGGSAFEVTDWWRKPRHASLWGELRVMLPEMLLLKGLKDFNRSLWYRSFPFHFGLYLIIASAALVVLVALWVMAAPAAIDGAAVRLLRIAYRVAGTTGAALTAAGAMGLLYRRLTHPDLRPYTTVGDVFNLSFFLVTIMLLAAGYLFRGAGAPGALALAGGLLRCDTSIRVPGLLAAGLMLGSALIAYIPLTHMSHFIAKYFTYHAVRWDDRPSLEDGRLQREVAAALTYRPTWAAAHIGADGIRTWADVATSTPPEAQKR